MLSIHPSSHEVKNEWSYTYTPSVRFHGADKDIFTHLPLPLLILLINSPFLGQKMGMGFSFIFLFLVALAKFRNVTISFVMFVRLSVRMEQVGSH
jgi:hypothetical protein